MYDDVTLDRTNTRSFTTKHGSLEGSSSEDKLDAPRIGWDGSVNLDFHGSKVTSDAGLLAYRQLNDAMDLITTTGGVLHDWWTGKTTRNTMITLLRQAVGGLARESHVASTSGMGRLETEVVTQTGNLDAQTNLSGRGIDRLSARRPSSEVILDMDSSLSETYGR